MGVNEASIRHEPLRAPRRARIASTPPLENGDRLTRAGFERRYEAMPHVKKALLPVGEPAARKDQLGHVFAWRSAADRERPDPSVRRQPHHGAAGVDGAG